ncbi:MAG: polymerase sigma-54 factor [Actinomycetota bacterium]|nr:polymerase sigma-54 factor [Actinomycetota bacterium]
MSGDVAPGLQTSLRVEVCTALVMGVELLALPQHDFEAELETASIRNPALVAKALPSCSRCGRTTSGSGCACGTTGSPSTGDPRLSPEPATVTSAWECLEQELSALLPASLSGVAATVLSALDEHGFIDPADLTGIPPEISSTVLAALREVGPPGIGAATARESLLLQLETAPLSEGERALAREILSLHSDVLETSGAGAVAPLLGCTVEQVTALLTRLSRLLRPYPGIVDADTTPTLRTPPDVLFERCGDLVEAIVPESERWVVDLDDGYRDALRQAGRTADPGQAAQLEQARKHLREARTLMRAVHRRWALMTGLADLLALEHAEPLLTGALTFGAFTQRTAAARLDVHESTISRAVRHRTARLVDGTVVPLQRLFGTGSDLRQAVAELIGRTPRPSDRAVAEILTARGIHVARRTVTKYRHALTS